MKTLELEIVQGFFFYSHYAFRYIFVKLDFAAHPINQGENSLIL